MRQRSAQLALAVVCFLLGIMLVVQFRTHTRIVNDVLKRPANEQWAYVASLSDSNQKLRQEVEDLRRQLNDYEESVGQSELARMVADINRLRVISGASEVSGPGVQVTIDGTLSGDGNLRPEDLQDLVNELRNAGAEAIAINGHRMAINSSFSRGAGGPQVHGGTVITTPYVIEAIGSANDLERALTRPAGLIAALQAQYPDARITVFHKTDLVLPKREQDLTLDLARAAE